MANTAPVLIWVADIDKCLQDFNKPWLDFTGRTFEQEFGRGWTENIHADEFSGYIGCCIDITERKRVEEELREADSREQTRNLMELQLAQKYTDLGGYVHITVKPDGDNVTISARDNGIGISASMLPHVFTMYIQATPVFDKPQGGLGIGLSIVKRLVEMHGGSINVNSDGPGKGSEFHVCLPTLTL